MPRNDKITMGLYGCNMYRTRDLVDAVLAGCPGKVTLSAGYDVNQAMLAAVQERYGVKGCATLDEFLGQDFDVALISLPPHLHAEAFELCAAAGKDVYLEKPVCVDEATRARLLASAARYPRTRCYVGLSYRHVTPFRKVAEILCRPEAGRILGVHHHWMMPRMDPMPASSYGWRQRFEQSGGQLVFHCCHLLDWFEWIGGPTTSVSATAYVPPDAHLPHEEREITAAFTYRSGALAVFNFSQHSHQNIQFGTVHTENLGIRYEWGSPSRVRVYATRPRAADEAYEWSLSSQAGDGGEMDRNVSQMREFVDAYLGGGQMPISLADGVRAYDMACGVRQSCRERRAISLTGENQPDVKKEYGYVARNA